MDNPLEEQLARVRRKVLDRGVKLDPPLSEEQVADFEARVGVRLPEEYWRFLLEIGDGTSEEMIYGRRLSQAELERDGFDASEVGYAIEPQHEAEQERREGPPHYGLQPLERTAFDSLGRPLHPELPFPLTVQWIWEDELEPDETDEVTSIDGYLFLGTEGCGEDWVLVVTGLERGRVWNIAEVGAGPCVPPATFLDWYERWLDERPYWERQCGFPLWCAATGCKQLGTHTEGRLRNQ